MLIVRGFSCTVDSKSALRSARTLLSRVQALPLVSWPDGGPESLRSPCCGLALYNAKPHCLWLCTSRLDNKAADAQTNLTRNWKRKVAAMGTGPKTMVLQISFRMQEKKVFEVVTSDLGFVKIDGWASQARAQIYQNINYAVTNLSYKFYELFMKKMSVSRQEDHINNYDIQVHSVLSNLNDPVTFFLPSDQAINSISLSARGELLGDSAKLLRIITLHIIPKKAVYTSLVNHNEQFNTQYNSGRVVFRKNFGRDAGMIGHACP
ncbi:hypothetical protein PoB_004807500 [Plakobranchus ocellatus]|uniref:FAS1 domain-containing protein n=1 Tax=Plakobranchus ocellatus TaxID=259542 RepID=A0AAV4BR37_9GAST|nr:hypothetical protein PoB_004807500 [Plakobranchus ocellatus]